MDVAYDHIQEEVLSPDAEEASKKASDAENQQKNLNTEFQAAYKSFSASPWGAKLGGFFNDVRKQGESYYKEAQQEASAAGEEALKGFTDLRSTLVNRARSMSAAKSGNQSEDVAEVLREMDGDTETTAATSVTAKETGREQEKEKAKTEEEALKDNEGLIARFRSEASKRLKEVQKAEDAADEALLKFGTNVRNFLRDAVTIAPPSETDSKPNKDGTSSKVLFESRDSEGKRVIHSTRFDAQLHAIHSSHQSFTRDPDNSAEYEKWKQTFDIDQKTSDIAKDLEKHDELRRAMEKLVPEAV
ncbi:MAG: hypothetical protein Q9190_008021, partial [Brigantiaea leucoxantha]